jgi:hypothetical protein
MPAELKQLMDKVSSSLLTSSVEQTAAIASSQGAVITDLGVFVSMKQKGFTKGIVLCIDRPASFYKEMLETNNIDWKGMSFINVGFKEEGENTKNIGDTPADLTFMKIEIARTAQNMRLKDSKKKIFMLNDAVTTLLLYNDEKVVGQFLHDLNNKLRELNVYMVTIIEPGEKIGILVKKLADVVVEL